MITIMLPFIIGKDSKEVDMTFIQFFFSKSVQSGPKVIQKLGNGQKHFKCGFRPL